MVTGMTIGHHQRLAPADGQPDQYDDRDSRETQMVEQFVGFLVGGFAIVAGHLDRHRLGDQRAFQMRGALEDLLCHEHRIGPCALGNRERHGRCPFHGIAGADHGCDDFRRLVGGECDVGKIAHIDRPAVAAGDQQVADLGGRIERFADHKIGGLAVDRHLARGKGAVGACHLRGQLLQGDPVKRKSLWIRCNPDDLVDIAHQIGKPDIVDLGEFGPEFAGDPGQVIGAHTLAGSRGGRQCQ
jgi:hypothetical protein